MNRLSRAKKEYQNIEIPSELSSVVDDAIRKNKENKPYKVNVFSKIIPAVSVCAVLCLVIGTSAFLKQGGDVNVAESDSEPVVVTENSRMVAASGAVVEFAEDSAAAQPEAEVPANKKSGEMQSETLTTVYIGEKYESYMVVDKNGNVRYLNLTTENGEEVSLADLGIEEYSEDTDFYISSENTVVLVFKDHVTEVRFG